MRVDSRSLCLKKTINEIETSQMKVATKFLTRLAYTSPEKTINIYAK